MQEKFFEEQRKIVELENQRRLQELQALERQRQEEQQRLQEEQRRLQEAEEQQRRHQQEESRRQREEAEMRRRQEQEEEERREKRVRFQEMEQESEYEVQTSVSHKKADFIWNESQSRNSWTFFGRRRRRKLFGSRLKWKRLEVKSQVFVRFAIFMNFVTRWQLLKLHDTQFQENWI